MMPSDPSPVAAPHHGRKKQRDIGRFGGQAAEDCAASTSLKGWWGPNKALWFDLTLTVPASFRTALL